MKIRVQTYFSHQTRLAALGVLLGFGAQAASASGTYIVGTCATGTQFKSIQSALNASPAPSTVEVCPGQYAEQITITRPVTLEGIAAGNGALAEIVLPSGYTTNATLNNEGDSFPAVVQVYVNNVSDGAVNLSNLAVTGGASGMSDVAVIGVVYQQSSGIINNLVTSHQDGPSVPAIGGTANISGWGMWILGGSSHPSVTVENSSFRNFNMGGIYASIDTDTTGPELTLAIKNSVFSAVSEGNIDITVDEGADATISGNIINGGSAGILEDSSSGLITGNTILGSQFGIMMTADGASLTSNNILGATQVGIDVSVPTLSTSKVEKNTIKTVKSPGEPDSTGTAIDLRCSNLSASQVNSNVLMDAYYGYANAPAGFAGSNTYLGVVSEVATCTSPSVTSQRSAAARLKVLQQSPGRHQS
jgi:hypothetical protein